MEKIIKRQFPASYEFKMEGDSAQKFYVRGHAALYDTPSDSAGWYTEIISRGAATEALKTSDIRALVNHEASELLARYDPNRDAALNTLEVRETDKGIEFVFDVPKSRPWIIESIMRNDMNQTSFAFSIDDDGDVWTERNENYGGNRTREIVKFSRLYDVSLVTYPFYEQTSFDYERKSYDRWKERQNAANEKRFLDPKVRQRQLDLRERKFF